MQDLQLYLDTKLEADDEFVVPRTNLLRFAKSIRPHGFSDDAMHRAANRGSMGS
jgi:hypothetical protein